MVLDAQKLRGCVEKLHTFEINSCIVSNNYKKIKRPISFFTFGRSSYLPEVGKS